MDKIDCMKKIPQSSMITKGFETYDYSDSFHKHITSDKEISEITAQLFSIPPWIKHLFKFRDVMVKPFGLKSEKEFNKNSLNMNKLMFNIIEKTDCEVIMEEKDRHLNFRASVLKTIDQNNTYIHITTLVKYNNFFGRLYFFPVKPFHKLIVKYMLKHNIQ